MLPFIPEPIEIDQDTISGFKVQTSPAIPASRLLKSGLYTITMTLALDYNRDPPSPNTTHRILNLVAETISAPKRRLWVPRDQQAK